MKRFAKHFRVFYVEEPVFGAEKEFISNSLSKEGVWVVIPHLPHGLAEEKVQPVIAALLDNFFNDFNIKNYIVWFYTPMAIPIAESLTPSVIVYDCMDELSAFKNAPPTLKDLEKQLVSKADLVFTGGYSLFEAKKAQHPCIFPFPSSIDKDHFHRARSILLDPLDQSAIPHPRIGFFGVIDERMDIELLRSMSKKRPDWSFIIVGPTVKIDPDTLPVDANIYYLGSKQYDELPDYLGGWDIAMMPFAINESTKFISPTKTPEYLAGGKPVISTPITDVINPYGEKGLVYIANDSDEFIKGIEDQLTMENRDGWLKAVDLFLANNSWDITAEKMIFQINTKLETKLRTKTKQKEDEYV